MDFGSVDGPSAIGEEHSLTKPIGQTSFGVLDRHNIFYEVVDLYNLL